jgi:hypothetical protein
MKVALVAFGLCGCVGLAACVRASESTVREAAAAQFGCADYALTVVEVGPDVYRASGCGQELIYACRPTRPAPTQDPDDTGDQSVITCARTPE